MNKEPTENDIKYPVLSMLFDGPNELAARAEALRGSIIHDMTNSSHPRLRQLEVIAGLLRPNFIDNGEPYQQALQQVSLADLRRLIEYSEKIDSHNRTELILTIERVQQLANQISLTVDVSQKHESGSLTWTESTSFDSTITLDAPVQQLEEFESGLSDNEIINRLDAKGYKIANTKISHVHYRGGSLSINNNLVFEVKSSGIDSRFLGLFFRGPEKFVKKAYQLGDIVELLKDKEDNPNLKNRQLYQRYSDARMRINRRVKAETSIDEFICYKDKTYFINRDLLKA